MQCREFYEVAEQWMEGERPAAAEAHLNACANCRSLIADLEAIARAGAALEATAPEPPERIWVSLRNQLEAEGIIREAGVRESWLAQAWAELGAGLRAVARRPAVALAYAGVLALAVLLSGAPSQQVAEDEIAQIKQRHMVKLLVLDQRVRTEAVPAFHRKNPIVADSYRQNLEIVDNFIVLCEKAVRENPDDPIAREYLFAAYQQKANLMAAVVERGVGD
jgi:hypothetical protein